MIKKAFLFMAIFLCFAVYGYAADITYDYLNYMMLTPGFSKQDTYGNHKKVMNYGQVNGQDAVEVTTWYSGDSPLRSLVMYNDENYIYLC